MDPGSRATNDNMQFMLGNRWPPLAPRSRGFFSYCGQQILAASGNADRFAFGDLRAHLTQVK